MTARTWTGAESNNAADPNNWTPTGIPQPGETLTMTGGTMDIRGQILAGDTLTIGQLATPVTATLNLSHHATATMDVLSGIPTGVAGVDVTVNVKGSDTLNFHEEYISGTKLTVNLADHATLTGSVGAEYISDLTMTGGPGSRYANISGGAGGAAAVYDVDVVGTGQFSAAPAQSLGGVLEFGRSVSQGQTVKVGGNNGQGVTSYLKVDHPHQFAGSVALQTFGEVDLQGLANADSYTYQNDMLSLYSGNKVIDVLRLTLPPPVGNAIPLTVSRTSTGIAVDRDYVPSSYTPLPMHG